MKCLIIGGLADSKLQDSQKENFWSDCEILGKVIREINDSLVICSPFNDSADYWVMKGYLSKGDLDSGNEINIIHANNDNIIEEINKLKEENRESNFKLKQNKSVDDIKYSWLLCQIEALESCDYVVAIGGKLEGSAQMLLALAISKHKKVIPFSFWDGAAKECYLNIFYNLNKLCEDSQSNILGQLLTTREKFQNLMEYRQIFKDIRKSNNNIAKDLKVFISYPRQKTYEADFIEMKLRRLKVNVYRDESKFEQGKEIQKEIIDTLNNSNVFIALWCRDYACSPWCYDEFDIAINKHQKGEMDLLILCLDNTRIVPKGARDLINYRVKNKKDIENEIMRFIYQKGVR